jgi:hypothetical protein
MECKSDTYGDRLRQNVLMRWFRLIADLESQLDALVGAEVVGEVAERTRMETSASHLADRLRAAGDHPIEVVCQGAGVVRGRLVDAGPDWLLLAEGPGREALVSCSAVLGVVGLARTVAPADTEVSRRSGIRRVLRGIARDRATVRMVLLEGSELSGTIDRVGADFLDLARHAVGEPRRVGAVRGEVAVPLRAVAVVRRC